MPEALNKLTAAEALGISRPTLYRWIESGRIATDADGNVPMAEIERVRAEARARIQERLGTYHDAAGAHGFFLEWIYTTHNVAFGQLLGACRDLLAAWGDAEIVADGTPAVQEARLRKAGAKVQAVTEAVQALERVHSLKPLLQALERETAVQGRELDQLTDVEVAAQKADREALRRELN